jgi:beta-1,4-mannosyltransferase
VVSSTSWTADEDFGLLLSAVKSVEERLAKLPKSPTIHLVITGKGDLREEFEAKVKNASLKHFRIFTAFLPHSDYAATLGSADLGVCLHFSSSKLDLPMKVVDMFGAALPVAALNYTWYVNY